MEQMGNIKVLFIAGFGPIVREPRASRKLYDRLLGIDMNFRRRRLGLSLRRQRPKGD
jgi:hypothetical protein